MKIKVYVKNDFIKQFNIKKEYKIIDNSGLALKQWNNNVLVSILTNDSERKYHSIIIPDKYLMIDYNKEENELYS